MTSKRFMRAWVLGLALGIAPLIAGCGGNPNKSTVQTATSKAAASVSASKAAATQQTTGFSALRAYAESGDVGAQYDLALSLADTDRAAAETWLIQAAMQGYGRAALALGQWQNDAKRAVEWYSMAAAMNDVEAQFRLGQAYLNGEGTAQETGWGLMWVERAARGGHAAAQWVLAQALATGKIGAPQREDALTWYQIAKANGADGDLNTAIAALKGVLAADSVYRAKLRAAQWTNATLDSASGDRAALRFAQFALDKLGYAPGPVDGISGVHTASAINTFRAEHGLGEGGVDGALLDRLRERLASKR